MYVQVITFSLDGISEDDYIDVANGLAPRIADLPGLQAKLWLENEGANRYGGIYFWDDVESMERFNRSDLFEGRVPEFTDLVIEEFGVLENLTAMTQPVLEILEARRSGAASLSAPVPAPASEPAQAARAPARKKRTPPPRSPAAAAPGKKKKKATPAKKAPARKTAKRAAR